MTESPGSFQSAFVGSTDSMAPAFRAVPIIAALVVPSLMIATVRWGRQDFLRRRMMP